MAGRRVHLHITGLVQGVSYRASARDEASRLGLTGWVRNLGDGSVEAVVDGPDHPVGEFIAWCRTGPSEARVDGVTIGDVGPGPAFADFRVVR